MEKLRNACWERFGNHTEVGIHPLMGNKARSPAPLLLQPAPPLRRVAKPRSAHYRRCCCANRSAGSIQGPWASKPSSNHQPDLRFCLQPHRSRNQHKSPQSSTGWGLRGSPSLSVTVQGSRARCSRACSGVARGSFPSSSFQPPINSMPVTSGNRRVRRGRQTAAREGNVNAAGKPGPSLTPGCCPAQPGGSGRGAAGVEVPVMVSPLPKGQHRPLGSPSRGSIVQTELGSIPVEADSAARTLGLSGGYLAAPAGS